MLSPTERTKLSYTMMEDVLHSGVEANLISSCFVVSSDGIALALAEKVGAMTVKETKTAGVNSAVRLGIERSKAGRFMILPADIPIISPPDIHAALSLDSDNADVVISPSRGFDGTNLLLFSKEKPVELSYDRNSFWNHLGMSAGRSVSVAVYNEPRVALDVDSEDDLITLAELEINIPSVNFAKRVLVNGPRNREL